MFLAISSLLLNSALTVSFAHFFYEPTNKRPLTVLGYVFRSLHVVTLSRARLL